MLGGSDTDAEGATGPTWLNSSFVGTPDTTALFRGGSGTAAGTFGRPLGTPVTSRGTTGVGTDETEGRGDTDEGSDETAWTAAADARGGQSVMMWRAAMAVALSK